MTDFIAVCNLSGFAGSWARDANADKAVARCAKIVNADWGTTFKLKGVKLKIGLFNAEGHESVSIGPDGVWDEEVAVPFLGTREVQL
jgi:hypothetical protein